MTQLLNHMEILKILPKTNCGECGAATCIAFAVQLKQGLKKLKQCPHLDSQTTRDYEVPPPEQPDLDQDSQALLGILKRLPRTNCQECNLTTCLDFATQVKQGRMRLEQCPHRLAESQAKG